MSESPQVALVVLSWNRWADTRECLESLRRVAYPAVAVYVVDNGSTDGSPAHVAREFPEVNLIPLPENRGFGGGMNAGIEAALRDGAEFVQCLNNDLTVDPGFLEPLVETAREEGLVPYPAVYEYGAPHALDSAGHRVDLYTGLTTPVSLGDPGLPESFQLMPRDLLQSLGPWDASYFAMYEDTEFGLRMRKAGWEPVCVPESRVYHKRGRTTGRIRGLVSYYSIRNRLRLVRDYGNAWQYATTLLHVLLLTLPYIGLRCLLSTSYKHSFRHVLQGLLDGLFRSRETVRRRWEMDAAPA